jgi:hypothetical protein
MAIYVALMNGRGIFAFDADDAEVHSFDQILCAEYEGGSGIYFRKAFAVEEEVARSSSGGPTTRGQGVQMGCPARSSA